MAPESYKAFRVRGIPAGSDKEGARKLIADALSCDEGIVIRVLSLANDCHRKNELVATVTFSQIPASLQSNSGSDQWFFEIRQGEGDDMEASLFFDTHFDGCTPLYSPPGDSWKLDIVAMSGLGGHALGSFKKRSGAYMWLRDSLPRDIPEARIIVYGYNTRIQRSTSFQNIPDLGTQLRSCLRIARPVLDKPLVLLGHSLGGIVIKEAINSMSTSSLMTDRKNFQSLRGVIFFGVPNQGMDITSLIPMVGAQPNRGFLHTLETNSPILRSQARQFSENLGFTNCEVINFYETQVSPTARKNDDGVWAMDGPPTVLVDPYSATHGKLYDTNGHHVHAINRSHSDLVKFENRYDDSYEIVVAQLHMLQPHARETAKKCLHSLAFLQQDWRELELQPTKGTCDWLFGHKSFRTWMESSKSLLWIRGKPGSGKSTLMKRAVQHFKDQNKPEQLVVSYFIHGQGVDLQKSPLGLYRSVIHQLFRKIPDEFAEMTATFVERAQTQANRWSWTEIELRKILSTTLMAASKKSTIILLVDALDEAGEDAATEVVENFQKLMRMMAGSEGNLKICFSCRHYPKLTLESDLTISMEYENSEDIVTVVKEQLSNFSAPDKDRLEDYLVHNSGGIFQWVMAISSHAKFLKKKGRSIRALFDRFQMVPANLHRLYESLLADIDDRPQTIKLFQWIIFSMEPLSLEQLRHALALDSCMKHASIKEYCSEDNFVDEEDIELYIIDLSKGLIEVKGSRIVEFVHQSVEDFLLNGGLIALEGRSDGSAKQRSHFQISRSCIRYLSMAEIRQHFAKFEISSLKEPWFDSDTAYQEEETEAKGQFPLIKYAWAWWSAHTIQAKSQDGDSDLLDLFRWPHDEDFLETWICIRRILGNPSNLTFGDYFIIMLGRGSFLNDLLKLPPDQMGCSVYREYMQVWAWPMPGSKLIHFLCLADFQNLVRDITRKGQSPDARDDAGLTPLVCAVSGKNKMMFRLLVEDAHADVNMATDNLQSPLHFATLLRDHEIVDELLDKGAIADAQDTAGFSPLSVATLLGDGYVVGKLLTAGADPNLLNAYGWAPLLFAARQGYWVVLAQLLSCGANANCQSPAGHKPLHLAAINNHAATVRILVQFGAIVDSKDKTGRTPLSYAAHCGHQNVVIQLIQAGADVNSGSLFGTPVALAQMEDHLDIVCMLIDAGATESWCIVAE